MFSTLLRQDPAEVIHLSRARSLSLFPSPPPPIVAREEGFPFSPLLDREGHIGFSPHLAADALRRSTFFSITTRSFSFFAQAIEVAASLSHLCGRGLNLGPLPSPPPSFGREKIIDQASFSPFARKFYGYLFFPAYWQ